MNNTLQKHEHKADGEEIMNSDGDDLAGGDRFAVLRILLLTVVQRGHHAQVGAQEGQLLAHVDHTGRVEYAEHEEQEQRDGQEHNDQG